MHLLVKKCTDSETVEPLNRALSFEVGHARRVPVVLLDFEEPGSSALARGGAAVPRCCGDRWNRDSISIEASVDTQIGDQLRLLLSRVSTLKLIKLEN